MSELSGNNPIHYIRDGRAPVPEKESTSHVMSANRGKNTKPEILFRKKLREVGLSGYRLHWKKAPGKPDIAFPGKHVAIFINGCFWHRCPHCNPSFPKINVEFWTKKFERNIERDKRKVEELERNGWKVFIIWECQIKKELSSCASEVENYIKSR
jgi:DNA mismatch endonuclease (patch repair protein)